MFQSCSQSSKLFMLACGVVAASVGCGPGDEATEDENGAEDSAALGDFGPIVTPDIAFELRARDQATLEFGCIDANAANQAATEIARQFRENGFATAFARARCVVPAGQDRERTTLGVWAGGSTNINFTASLAQLDLIGGQDIGIADVATWVSTPFMQTLLAINAEDNDRFDVQDTDVITQTPFQYVRSVVQGETKVGNVNVTAVWDEVLAPVPSSQTQPGAPTATRCPRVPSALTSHAIRHLLSSLPDILLQDFKENAVLRALVDAGLFPSRMVTKPQPSADPLLGTVLRLSYLVTDIEVIHAGLLDGVVVVANPGPGAQENRLTCVRIQPKTLGSFVLPTYEASTFDLRPPLTFQWTSSPNVIIATPTQRSTNVTFTNTLPGHIELTVTDADGVSPPVEHRNISTSNP